STSRFTQSEAQYSETQRCQRSGDNRNCAGIWREIFLWPTRIWLWRLPLRWTLDTLCQGYCCALQSLNRKSRTPHLFFEGISGEGPDEGLPRARGLWTGYILLCVDALRAGGDWPLASRHGGTAAVPRSRL